MVGELAGTLLAVDRFAKYNKLSEPEEVFLRWLHMRMKRHSEKKLPSNWKIHEGVGHGYTVVLAIFEKHYPILKLPVKKSN
jgi:hypothetical protein